MNRISIYGVAVLLFFFTAMSAPQVSAQDASGAVETTPQEMQYRELSHEIRENMRKLEALGGGMAPFVRRLEEIDAVYAKGDIGAALKDLSSLSQNVDEQLKRLNALRSEKRIVPVVVRTAAQKPQAGSYARTNAVVQDARKDDAKQSEGQEVVCYSQFKGSADDFLKVIAEEIASRELGGLGIPVRGPFRLERFRNLRRINELRQKGQKIDGYLDFYRRTEEIASSARKDGTLIGQLSSAVRYLEQQLGLEPLSGSLSAKTF